MVRWTVGALTYDVRRLPAAKTQSAILSMVDGLRPGQSFRAICDFELARLRRSFAGFFGEEHRWTYRRRRPPLWQIKIGKPAAPRNGE